MFKRRVGRSQADQAMGGALSGLAEPPAGQALEFSGVSLLTSSGEGPISVPGLGLRFGPAGVTVSKPTGEVVRTMPWGSLTGLATEGPGEGGPGSVVLRVSAGERSHRFVVPTEDPAGFEDSLARLARHYRSQPPPAPPEAPPQAVPGQAGPMAFVPGPNPLGQPLAAQPTTQQPAVPPPAAPAEPGPGVARPPSSGPFTPTHPQGPALAGMAASAGVGPEPSLAGRGRTRGRTWALLAVLVVVAALAGLYLAQRQGYIHFLPKSIVSPPTSASAPAAPVRPAARPPTPVAGLQLSTVLQVLALQGFSCPAPTSGVYSCRRPAGDAAARVVVASPGVASVTVTFAGPAQAAGPLFQAVASLPYQGAVPQAASSFVSSHLGSSSQVSIGAAKLTLTQISAGQAPPSSVLTLSPAS
ncbi:MAG TPA: hypothetical protein VKY15_05655 [Acidimicrobiales bacterium]|nr:hypothetical protein [Acidimicrobiales bacterium]